MGGAFVAGASLALGDGEKRPAVHRELGSNEPPREPYLRPSREADERLEIHSEVIVAPTPRQGEPRLADHHVGYRGECEPLAGPRPIDSRAARPLIRQVKFSVYNLLRDPRDWPIRHEVQISSLLSGPGGARTHNLRRSAN